MNSTVIGLDLAKNVFHYAVVNQHGEVVRRKQLRRKQMLSHFAKLEPSTVALEACSGAHYWGRELRALGHTAVILPANKISPFRQGQKNDFNDARAIAQAQLHGGIRPVALKSEAEQHAQAWRKLRRQTIDRRSALASQIRSLLCESGLVVRVGLAALRRELVRLLDPQCETLHPSLRSLLTLQYEELVAIDERVASFERETVRQAKEDPKCVALQALSGVGPVVAVSLVGWFGEVSRFENGRSAAAALGLVPRQHSSGGKSRLGGITKCGDALVRCHVVHGARAAVKSALTKEKPNALERWIQVLVMRRGVNKATVALAAKIVRIAWAMLSTGEVYNANKAAQAA